MRRQRAVPAGAARRTPDAAAAIKHDSIGGGELLVECRKLVVECLCREVVTAFDVVALEKMEIDIH